MKPVTELDAMARIGRGEIERRLDFLLSMSAYNQAKPRNARKIAKYRAALRIIK
jgi:hypothetical protein